VANWTETEVRIAVEAYLKMLRLELSGASVNKSAVRRDVLPRLDDRTNSSLEFKNCNISAALLDLGYPAIDGYKPRWNYQKSVLPHVVDEMLAEDDHLRKEIADHVTSTMDFGGKSELLLEDPPPIPDNKYRVEEPNQTSDNKPRHINFLEIESKNSALGLRGEELTVEFEKSRLIRIGQDHLADRVEHVSKDQGDGAGFDILSFDENGDDRFIEVKTTRFSKHTPFFITENEVGFSKQRSDNYHLYRIFNFRETPKLFTLSGDISKNCILTPSVFKGRFAS